MEASAWPGITDVGRERVRHAGGDLYHMEEMQVQNTDLYTEGQD